MIRQVLLAIMVVAGASICAGLQPTMAQTDRITIGVAGPMSGQYASYGAELRQGAEQAVEDINATGGVLGLPLVLKVGDDMCKKKNALSVAKEFARQGVVLVAGHFCSGSSIPAAEIYEDEDIIMISPASTNPSLTELDLANVFRVVGRDDHQGVFAGDFLAENFGDGEIAILFSKGYGEMLAKNAKAQLRRRGVREAIYDEYTPDRSNYSRLVSNLKSRGIQVIFLGGFHGDAATIIREAHDQDFYPQLLGGDALVTDMYWEQAGAAGEGTMMVFSPDPRKLATASDLVKRMRARNFEPVGYTLYTYAAIQAWAQAVQKANTTEIDAVIDSLRENQFDTVIGTIGFDENGDIVGIENFVIYTWRNGVYDHQ